MNNTIVDLKNNGLNGYDSAQTIEDSHKKRMQCTRLIEKKHSNLTQKNQT